MTWSLNVPAYPLMWESQTCRRPVESTFSATNGFSSCVVWRKFMWFWRSTELVCCLRITMYELFTVPCGCSATSRGAVANGDRSLGMS